LIDFSQKDVLNVKNELYLIVIGCLLVSLTAWAGASEQDAEQRPDAKTQLPSKADIDAWYAKFQAGLYDIENYQLDPQTEQPKKDTITTKQDCLSSFEISTLSSLPVVSFIEKSCQLMQAQLDETRFFTRGACRDEQQQVVLKQVSVSLSEDHNKIVIHGISALKQNEQDGDLKMLTANGSTLVRRGDCSE
jgi:hypothetical protein